MDYDEIVKHLGPCGLDCSRCADNEDGEIKSLASRLIHLLRNYDKVAKLKAQGKSAFGGYAQFEEVLKTFSEASCGGCRSDNVQCFITCAARNCHKEKGIDFCFQCNDYPCDKEFHDRIRQRWMQLNDRMKEVGVDQFFLEQNELPRY
jgi:hypothetical protein